MHSHIFTECSYFLGELSLRFGLQLINPALKDGTSGGKQPFPLGRI